MADEKIPGITKIAVKGFKSIAEECEIDIRPLTILAGANSSGKSSIMQPLLMLKQTLEAPYDPGPLLIDGPNVQFSEIAQFLSTLPEGKKADRFQIRIETYESDVVESVKTVFGNESSAIDIISLHIETKSVFDPSPCPVCSFLHPNMSSDAIKSIIKEHRIPGPFDVVKRSRCFLILVSHDGRHLSLTQNLESKVLTSIHLPGLRGNPERIYKLTSTGTRFPGTFENYVASVIHEWQETADERLKTVTNALHTLELTGKVATERIGDIGIEVKVGRLPHHSTDETDMVNIADVGIGVSQVLPVLVALIVAEPGQLVYLEQPELHLQLSLIHI